METARHILNSLDAHAGAVQAVSAIIVAILTGFLVAYTKKYVKETADSLSVARDQLTVLRQQIADQEASSVLARAQFEQEWMPDLRIGEFTLASPSTKCRFVNLGRSAAFVKGVRIGTGGNDANPPQDVDTFPLFCLVPAGDTVTDIETAGRIWKYGDKHLPRGASNQWQVSMSVALVYDCAGKTNITSQWFQCTVDFRILREVTGTRLEIANIVPR